MKNLKNLRGKLISKDVGFQYIYLINDTRFEICEFNYQKGWCLNEYRGEELVHSYGYEGLLLRECKAMILMAWNNGELG
jgi:hypothetical protein